MNLSIHILLFILLVLVAMLFSRARNASPRYYGGADGVRKNKSDESTAQSTTTPPPFPYKRESMTEEGVVKCFENLRNLDIAPLVRHERAKINGAIDEAFLCWYGDKGEAENKYLTFLLPPNEYTDYNNISDYFNEHVRVGCRKSYAMSPLDFWAQNYKKIIAESRRVRGSDSPFHVRETQYTLFKRECETFKPSNAVSLIKYFGAKSYLDISAGWGDRLAACLSLGIRYVGADPNEALHAGYKSMVDFYFERVSKNHKGDSQKDDDNKQTLLICDGFLEAMDAHDSAEKFDLVLSSPPYFDLEIYDNGKKQSIVKFNKLDAWFDGFLIPAMTTAFNRLNPGGHLVINIEDDFKNKYVSKMIDVFTKKIKNEGTGEYLGTIVFTKSLDAVGRPFFVWLKN